MIRTVQLNFIRVFTARCAAVSVLRPRVLPRGCASLHISSAQRANPPQPPKDGHGAPFHHVDSATSATSASSSSAPAHVRLSAEETHQRIQAEMDRLQREEEAFKEDSSGMTPEERATTGPNAETSEIPRTGPMPTNPFAPLTQAQIDCTDGASCPSYPWDHSPHAKNNESLKLLKALPYPHPLPPVYTHSVGYRPSAELRQPWQRLLHVLSVVLCITLPVLVLYHADFNLKSRAGQPMGREPLSIQVWSRRRWAELSLTPAEVKAAKLYALGVAPDQLPEAKKARTAVEQLKADLAVAAEQSRKQREAGR